MNPDRSRDEAFDFVKGVLVCMMVVYHVMNASTAGADSYRYVRFVSGSFIFVSGLIISRFVAASFARHPGSTAARLVSRGLKILLLFTLLNLAIHATGFGNAAKQQLGLRGFVDQLDTIYLLGYSGIASFVILLPIGYSLLIAPLFLRIAGPTRRTATIGVLAATLAIAAALGSQPVPLVVAFMLVGITGMCLGSLAWVARPSQNSPARSSLTYAALALSLWFTAVTSTNLALYCVGVALIIRFLHESALHFRPDGLAGRGAILLGRYSLFAYIAQIGVIQCIFRASGNRPLATALEMSAIMGSTVALLLVLCGLLDEARGRYATIDKAYRLVFA